MSPLASSGLFGNLIPEEAVMRALCSERLVRAHPGLPGFAQWMTAFPSKAAFALMGIFDPGCVERRESGTVH